MGFNSLDDKAKNRYNKWRQERTMRKNNSNYKSVHEPEAKVMDAMEVWEDAQQIANVLRQNLLKAESDIRLQIPLSSFLSALDNFNREEQVIPFLLHPSLEK